MFLNDFPGQQHLKEYFSRIIAEDRVPHAILLSGEEGRGKLALAHGLASLLQCESPVDGLSCKTCSQCQKARDHVHPDIHYAFPVITKKDFKRKDTTSAHFINEWRNFRKENPFGILDDWLRAIDGITNKYDINVAECNAIIKQLGLKSYEGNYKVQIIWHAEQLGKESNRLLKLIEEPSPDTVIILIADSQDSLLNTIQSRCQIINVPPFGDADIIRFLKNRFSVSDEKAAEICFVASGNLRKAVQLASNENSAYAGELLNWLRVSHKGDPEELTAFVEYLAGKGRQEVTSFFRYGLHFIREFHAGMLGLNLDSLRLSETEKRTSEGLRKYLGTSGTKSLADNLSEAISMVPRNLSLKILLMHLSLRVHALLRAPGMTV